MSRKSRGKWNTADWFLLLLALLSVGGILLRAWGLRRGKSEDLREYEIVAVWEDVDPRTVSCLEEDSVLYTAAGEAFGRVIWVEESPAVTELVANGELYRLPSEQRLNVTVEITVRGSVSDGRFLREGIEPILSGQELRLYSDWAELPLRIVYVSPEPVF